MMSHNVQKYLPFVNFVIASCALCFQVKVLYPWHDSLRTQFHQLQREQEEKLRVYHESKMEMIKNLQEMIEKEL